MKENDFTPLNMDPFKKEWEKKNNQPNKEESESSSDETIHQFKMEGMETPIVAHSGYSAYFLKDLNKLKIETDSHMFEYEDGDEWKEHLILNEVAKQIEKQVREHIKEKGDTPIELVFFSDFADKLYEFGILKTKNFYTHFYYLPKEYDRDIEKYNSYIIETKKKEAAEEFAKQVRNINLN